MGEGESRKTVEAGGWEDTVRQRKRSTKGEELAESGGLVNSVTKESKVAAAVRDAEGDASSGLRRSSRAKSSWTPFPKEDCCTRRKTLGELSRSAELQSCLPWGVTDQSGAQGSTTGGAGTEHRSSRQKTGCT